MICLSTTLFYWFCWVLAHNPHKQELCVPHFWSILLYFFFIMFYSFLSRTSILHIKTESLIFFFLHFFFIYYRSFYFEQYSLMVLAYFIEFLFLTCLYLIGALSYSHEFLLFLTLTLFPGYNSFFSALRIQISVKSSFLIFWVCSFILSSVPHIPSFS